MRKDMADRLSFLSTGGSLNGDSSTTNGGYMGVKTPLVDGGTPTGRFEGGALREGGAPDLLSREMIGLLAQYAAVGLIYGSLPGTIYPFLTNYLNVEPNQSVAARTLVLIPWSFKVFYGFLTDCFPIYGMRRRPYMLLGWAQCIAMLFIMGFTQIGDPYYPDPELSGIEEAKMTPEQRLSLNKDAQQQGGKYVVLMMFSSVGYLMADVTADALTVEYAQREPEDIRGRTQTAIYSVRTIFMVVANLLSAFTFNGKNYGGDFEWSLSFPSYMLLLAVVMCPILPMTWALIKEQHCESPGFGNYIREFWAVLQTRAVYQIIAYKFFGGLFENFSYVAADQIQSKWVGVTPLNDKMAIIASYAITAGGMVIAGRYGLHWNWRVITAATMIIMVAIDAICTLFVTWDIIRSQFFYLSLPTIEFFPYSIGFIVSTFVVVEIAEMGHEGAIYGLLTTVSNLSDPFAKTLTKNVNQPFNITVDAIKKDDTEVRTNVTITLLIMYTMKLLSLAWLPLLPSQKKATQVLKAHGGKSRAMGLFTVMYISFAMIWSVTTNLMSMFASTQCLAISGGSGCDSKNTKDAKTNS